MVQHADITRAASVELHSVQHFELPELAGISREQVEVHLKLYEGYVAALSREPGVRRRVLSQLELGRDRGTLRGALAACGRFLAAQQHVARAAASVAGTGCTRRDDERRELG